jgi:hypothetical protein|tara:strand:- start:2708 stop:3388 length:681 start_codon:yes stop_codon:yes gene_type:complete
MNNETLNLLVTYIEDSHALLENDGLAPVPVNHAANIIIHCGALLSQSSAAWQPSIYTMDHMPPRIKDDSLYRLWLDCLGLSINDVAGHGDGWSINDALSNAPFSTRPKLGITHHIEHLLVSSITSQPDYSHLVALTDLFGIGDERLLKGVYITVALDAFRRKMAIRPVVNEVYVTDDPAIGWNDIDTAYTGSEDLSVFHRESRFFSTIVSRLEQSWVMAVSLAHTT